MCFCVFGLCACSFDFVSALVCFVYVSLFVGMRVSLIDSVWRVVVAVFCVRLFNVFYVCFVCVVCVSFVCAGLVCVYAL